MKTIFNPTIIVILCVLILITIIVFIVLPPSKGNVKPFLDSDGNIISTSIAEKVFIDVNGCRQGMIIRGEDISKPVIMFLSGGPGIPQYWLSYEYPTDLEKHFVVCYWSYRDNGLSFHSDEKKEDMTTDQFLSDSIEVIKYLQERFSQEKVILLAHSFGTKLGIQLVSTNPELFSCYIAMSQIVDQQRSEEIAFNYMKNEYVKNNNTKMIKKFEKFDINNPEDYHGYIHSSLRDAAMHGLGVGTTHKMKNVILEIFFPTLRMKDFTPTERINIWRGKAFSSKCSVVDKSFSFNALDTITSINIPIYFLCGKYDYTCVHELQKEYYEKITAPKKEFFYFENSAHSPLYEEPEKAIEIIMKITRE